MKIPLKPPDHLTLLTKIGLDKYVKILPTLNAAPLPEEYLHWDKLRHLSPPADVSHDEWWMFLKSQRRPLYKLIPLMDARGGPFRFLTVDPMPEKLHYIDQDAGGRIGVSAPVVNPQTRDQYYISSLIEEAITSSQLEGAATTREVAKEMLLTQRSPNDRSERMILNNFMTMRRIGQVKDQRMTPELVFEIHTLVTENTLDDSSAAGRFRRADEDIVVRDEQGVVYHAPPPAAELADRLKAMCAFANGETPGYFIHPAVRAIILHFWLAFDHPFVDGNGRTARALFYWAMLHYGYWLCEYVSISRVLKKAPIQYQRAFLYTETDDNDLTYFILHQLDMLRQAINDLHKYIAGKVSQQQETEQRLRGMRRFNPRQRALISHALRHPHFQYTIEGHKTSQNIVHQTARTDLFELASSDLLEAEKHGRTWHFTPAPDIEKKLAGMS